MTGRPTHHPDAPDADLTETVQTAAVSDEAVEHDVMSDPAHDDHVGSDWVDEGGATPAGPATDTPSHGGQG